MKNFARRTALVLSATAVSVGLMGVAAPAEAAKQSQGQSARPDSSWD